MATGRPQKGMTRKNHHDSLSQSGQQRYTSGNSTSPRTTYSSAPTPKDTQSKASTPRMGRGGNTNSKAPYKSF